MGGGYPPEGWGLVGCSKEGQVQGRVGLLRRGQGLGGESYFSSCLGVREGLAWRGKGSGGRSKGFGSGGGRW